MLALDEIEDALIRDMKSNIDGIKTVDTHEKEFNEETLKDLIPKTPFSLISYMGTTPDEEERFSNNASGNCVREFFLAIGATSLRGKKDAQRGAYTILDAIRNRYNGLTLSVGGETVTFYYAGDRMWFTWKEFVVYRMSLKWFEN